MKSLVLVSSNSLTLSDTAFRKHAWPLAPISRQLVRGFSATRQRYPGPGHLQLACGHQRTERLRPQQGHRKALRRRSIVSGGKHAPLQIAQRRLDGRILALLLPAMLAVFLDPLMALTDTGALHEILPLAGSVSAK